MRLETFFEKFDQFVGAPNAVTKMRELVLELAVQGKLVPQDDRDEPAAKRLERISAVNANGRLVARTRTTTKVPFDADNDSQCVGDHVEFLNGYGFKSEWFRPSGVRLCRNANVSHGILDWRETEYVDHKLAKEHERFALNEGDVVLSLDRPLISTGLKVAQVKKADLPCLLLQRVAKAIPKHDQLDMSYFLVWLNSSEFVGSIDPGRSKGVPHIFTRQVERLPFVLPPLAEQRRIVANVDQLMALCDGLETQQQERETRHAALARASLARFADAPTPANLDFLFHKSYAIDPADLRKSIFTLAVQGKLVTQDPNDEPPLRSFSGLKPLASESHETSDLPDQWEHCTYLSLTSLVTSGSRGWKEFYSKTGAIFIRTQNIKTDRLILDDVAFVDPPHSAERAHSQVRKDDIMVTITGANVTKAARVEEKLSEAYVSQHVALTRPRWPEMSQWLHLCFISHGSARGTLERLAYGDKPGLNLNNIRDLVLPIPPLAEQRRIVAKVDQLMALVDQLETQLAASRAAAEKLLQALVAELTAHDRPASQPGQAAPHHKAPRKALATAWRNQ